jgi:hypothetical protein
MCVGGGVRDSVAPSASKSLNLGVGAERIANETPRRIFDVLKLVLTRRFQDELDRSRTTRSLSLSKGGEVKSN